MANAHMSHKFLLKPKTVMKRKTKLKNLAGDQTEDGDRHGNDVSNEGATEGAAAVRRSSRKRSTPKEFVASTKSSQGYWSIKQKQKLLTVLEELNERKLTPTNFTYRYPLQIIKKRVGGKSLNDVHRFMRMLEHRAAKAALVHMKEQPPLESWRQMSDKLTVLTGDDCCRHLIKVCNIMALECKEIGDGPAKESTKCTEKTSVVTSVPPSKLCDSATPTKKTVMSQAPAEARASGAASPESSSPLEAGTASPSAGGTNTPMAPDSQPAASDAEATASSGRTHAGPAAPAAAAETAAPTTERETAAAERETAAAAEAAEIEAESSEDIQVIPDYASIYKYIASLMRGEHKELGPLESLVVLDCLELVEEHLKGRNNSEPRAFAQERFWDILQKLYLSIDCEDTLEKTHSAKDGDPTEPITMADLLGLRNESQTGAQPADQLGVEELLNEQSVCHSASEADASNSELVNIPEATCQRLRLKEIGLGSLNPFSIPLSLLDIRKGK